MIKILYVVSNLRRTGPINQLSYIIGFLNKEKYSCRVLCLSPEPADSDIERYKSLGIEVDNLCLSRVQGFIKGKARLKSYIERFNPDIIQTQGIRADSLLASIETAIPWISTARNVPIEDYPSKFGFILGHYMAYTHLASFRKCRFLISCSEYISSKLSEKNIRAVPIHNGIPVFRDHPSQSRGDDDMSFVTVGSLIPRKNMVFIINVFNKYLNQYNGKLHILGDGPLLSELKSQATNPNIIFHGKVNDVRSFLLKSNIFLSSSISEGLPNTVLEALASGLPVVLSNIPAHKEITVKMDEEYFELIDLNETVESLIHKMPMIVKKLSNVNRCDIINIAHSEFSAEAMSKKYQSVYDKVV